MTNTERCKNQLASKNVLLFFPVHTLPDQIPRILNKRFQPVYISVM